MIEIKGLRELMRSSLRREIFQIYKSCYFASLFGHWTLDISIGHYIGVAYYLVDGHLAKLGGILNGCWPSYLFFYLLSFYDHPIWDRSSFMGPPTNLVLAPFAIIKVPCFHLSRFRTIC